MEETDKQREEREWEEALESLFSGEQQNDSLHTPERQEKAESTPWWLTEESLLGEVELDYTGEDPKDSSVTPSQTATQQKGVIKLDQADPAPFQAEPASPLSGPAPLETKVAFNQ